MIASRLSCHSLTEMFANDQFALGWKVLSSTIVFVWGAKCLSPERSVHAIG